MLLQGGPYEPTHFQNSFVFIFFRIFFIRNATKTDKATLNYSKWPPFASIHVFRRLGKSSTIFTKLFTEISSHALRSARFNDSTFLWGLAQAFASRMLHTD